MSTNINIPVDAENAPIPAMKLRPRKSLNGNVLGDISNKVIDRVSDAKFFSDKLSERNSDNLIEKISKKRVK